MQDFLIVTAAYLHVETLVRNFVLSPHETSFLLSSAANCEAVFVRDTNEVLPREAFPETRKQALSGTTPLEDLHLSAQLLSDTASRHLLYNPVLTLRTTRRRRNKIPRGF